jgi:hypothetical protein
MAKPSYILGGAYEVIGVIPGEIGYKGGSVDLRRIDEAHAAKLVKAGFPYLKKVESKQPGKQAEPAKAEKADKDK